MKAVDGGTRHQHQQPAWWTDSWKHFLYVQLAELMIIASALRLAQLAVPLAVSTTDPRVCSGFLAVEFFCWMCLSVETAPLVAGWWASVFLWAGSRFWSALIGSWWPVWTGGAAPAGVRTSCRPSTRTWGWWTFRTRSRRCSRFCRLNGPELCYTQIAC